MEPLLTQYVTYLLQHPEQGGCVITDVKIARTIDSRIVIGSYENNARFAVLTNEETKWSYLIPQDNAAHPKKVILTTGETGAYRTMLPLNREYLDAFEQNPVQTARIYGIAGVIGAPLSKEEALDHPLKVLASEEIYQQYIEAAYRRGPIAFRVNIPQEHAERSHVVLLSWQGLAVRVKENA